MSLRFYQSQRFFNQPLPGYLKKSLSEISWVVLDLEMTGGNPEKDGILEICALKYHRGVVGESFYQLINPRRHLSFILQRMTGIKPRMLADCPTIEEVMPSFLEFLGSESVLIAHNVACDLRFLRHYAHQVTGSNLENFALCTHLLATKIYPAAEKKTLKGLCEILKLPTSAAHRAQADTQMTWELFQKIEEACGELSLDTLEKVLRYQGDHESLRRLGWRIHSERIEAMPHQSGVYWLVSEEEEPLLWGSAADLKRHLQQLPHSKVFGRSQLKKIMAATQVHWQITDHLLDAFLYHLQTPRTLFSCSQEKKEMSPYSFYEPTYLLVIPDSKACSYTLSLGKPTKDMIAIYGPIYQCDRGKSWLKEIASQYKLDCVKNTLRVKPSSFFLSHPSSFKQRGVRQFLKSAYQYLVLRCHPHGPWFVLKNWIEKQMPSTWKDLSSIWGYMVVDGSNRAGKKKASSSITKIYPIYRGELHNPILSSEPFEVWQKSPEGQSLAQKINQRLTQQRRIKESTWKHSNRERLSLGVWLFAFREDKKKLQGARFVLADSLTLRE